jgi:LPS sulfotransferase NodH
VPAPASYLLCATPRSGSSLLSRLLERTGCLGMVPAPLIDTEYLLDLTERGREIDWGRIELGAYLADCLARSRTPNGVAAFKVMWREVDVVCRRFGVASAEFAGIVSADTRYVLLTRDDELGQAVSFAKANHSQCWNPREQAAFRGRYVFDHRAIDAAARFLAEQRAGWSGFFATTGIEPLHVRFEALVADPAATVDSIARFVGLETAPFVTGDEVFARQADALDGEWRRRYEVIRAAGLRADARFRVASYPRSLLASSLRRLREHRRRRDRRRWRRAQAQATSGCAVPSTPAISSPK